MLPPFAIRPLVVELEAANVCGIVGLLVIGAALE